MMDTTNIERDHQPIECGCCAGCSVACKHGSGMHVYYPCDAARLLARVRELEGALKAALCWDGHARDCPMPYGRDCFDSCKAARAALAGVE